MAITICIVAFCRTNFNYINYSDEETIVHFADFVFLKKNQFSTYKIVKYVDFRLLLKNVRQQIPDGYIFETQKTI